MAKRVGPVGQVHAFEPEPDLLKVLEANVVMNGIRSWTSTSGKAISDCTGEGKLWHDGSNTGGASLISACIASVDGVGAHDPVTVTMDTLDDYAASNVAGDMDLVKIDVQGNEERVIRGGWSSILASKSTLAFEFNPIQFAEAGVEAADLLELLLSESYEILVASEIPSKAKHFTRRHFDEWKKRRTLQDWDGLLNVAAVHRERLQEFPWCQELGHS
jgi:FkbM family methyltransferase